MLNSRTPTVKISPTDTDVPLEWSVGDLIINTYEVKQVFTSGGMALVYRVHHRGWGIDLAVKTPRPEMLTYPDSVENFVEEAETWVNLGLHPQVVSCYYVRSLGGIPRIFMEYVNGGSLEEGIQQGWLYAGTQREVLKHMLDIAIQFAWGLHHAHEMGLIHQDVKPANVLLTTDGLAKVTDFGIAHAREKIRANPFPPVAQGPSGDGSKSVLVDTMGMTPLYCSPEQFAGKLVSRRSDIWSWAISVMEMFIGQRTWKNGQRAGEGLQEYRATGAELASIPPMPAGLADLLEECFNPDPDSRPHDMLIVARRLQTIYEKELNQAYPRPEPRSETILADSLNNRGVSMIDLGREKDALAYFDQALKAEINHATALYNRCLFQWRTSQISDQEAVAMLCESIARNPQEWEPFYFLSLIHMERGDTAEAVRVVQQGSERFGEISAFKNIQQVAVRKLRASGGNIRTVQTSHSTVNSIELSKNGDLILSAGNDSLVQVWDAASGDCLRRIEGGDAAIRVARFLPDNQRALSGSVDGVLRLWDLASGTGLAEFRGHEDSIQDVAITFDGSKAVSASVDGTLRVWDLATGECLQCLYGHSDPVWSVVLPKDGQTAVSSSFDNTLRIWDLASGQCLKIIDWVRSCTSNLSLTPDDHHVLLGGGDNRLWQVDLDTGEPVGSYSGHKGPISAVKAASSGSWAISGGMDGSVRLWDVITGRCLRTFVGHQSQVTSVALLPGKKLGISGSSDQTMRIWQLETGARAPHITVFPRSSQDVSRLSEQMENDLKQVEQLLQAQDYAGAMELVSRLRSNKESLQNPRLLEDWERIGRKGIREGLSDVWLVRSFLTHSATLNTIALSTDGRAALVGSEDKTVGLWELENAACLRELKGHANGVTGIAFSANNRQALSSSSDGSLRYWRLDTCECLSVLTGHTSEVRGISISPDGLRALSCSHDTTLRVWDLSHGRSIRVLKGHTHYVRAAALTPDGLRGVSASWDKTVRLWDLETGECLHVFEGHTGVIDALVVSPDGRVAVSTGNDHTLHWWDLESRTERQVVDRIPQKVTALTFAPDGRTLFSGEEDGSIGVWDARNGELLRRFRAHSMPVTAIALSRDGTHLVSGSSDRLLKIWRLDWSYTLPAEVNSDATLLAFLDAFILVHRPYANGGIARAGKSNWNQADYDLLVQDLSFRGYGGMDEDELIGLLRQRSR